MGTPFKALTSRLEKVSFDYDARELLSDAVAGLGAGYRGYRSQEHDRAIRAERASGARALAAIGKGDLDTHFRRRHETDALAKLTNAAREKERGGALAAGVTSLAPVLDSNLLAALAGAGGQVGASALLNRFSPGAHPLAGAAASVAGSLGGRMALRALLSGPAPVDN